MKALSIVVIAANLCACASPGPAPQAQLLSVLSWNILHGADEHGALNLDAKGLYIARQHAELVFLQEVDQHCRRSNNVDQMAELAQATGLDPAFGGFMDFEGGRYGLGMLSGRPCIGTRVLELPPGDEPRVALLREVQVLGRTLLCVDVHFNWIADDRARFAQAQALLSELERSGEACIVAGDFNDQPGSRTLEAFYSAGFRHVDPAGPSWNARAPTKDIDHILIRPGVDLELEGLGGEILDGDLLSDHCALRGRIRASLPARQLPARG